MNFAFFAVLLCLTVYSLDVANGFPLMIEEESKPELYTDGGTTMGDMGGGHDMSMKMYFHSTVHATILFQGWHTMNWWELLLSCIAIAVFAVLYEGLKFLREWMMQRHSKNTVTITNGDDKQMSIETTQEKQEISRFSTPHIIQSLLHFGQMFAGYSLMMVFMTFNIYLCLFLCIGGGVGYFIFGPRKIFKGISECCD